MSLCLPEVRLGVGGETSIHGLLSEAERMCSSKVHNLGHRTQCSDSSNNHIEGNCTINPSSQKPPLKIQYIFD